MGKSNRFPACFRLVRGMLGRRRGRWVLFCSVLAAAVCAGAVPPPKTGLVLGEPLVFPSYYRDDVAVQVPVKPAGAVGARDLDLEVVLRAGDLAVRRQTRVTRSPVEVTLPLDGVPPGPYEIRVRLRRGDRTLGQRRVQLERLRSRSVRDASVRVADDLRLIVRGHRFFPIAIYETPLTDAALDELAKAGFNTVRLDIAPPSVLRPILGRLHARGMMAWIALGHLIEIKDVGGAKAKRLRDLVAALRDEPALLVWESLDEPAWGKRDPDALLNGYRIVRRLDPDHPVWMNHAPRNRIATLARFNLAADITGCDIYPVPEPQTQSNLPNKTLSVVGDEADKNRAAVLYRKPIFMVLQGFAWGRLRHREGVYPTFGQQRFMAWDAVLHGASGIFYWGTRYTPKPSRAWADVKTIARELRALAPMLLAPEARSDTQPTVTPDNVGIEAMLRRAGDHWFLAAVNTGKEAAHATLSGLPLSVTALHVLYEDRRLPVRNGKVDLALPGFGVVLATTDPGLHPERPDYSAELAQPRQEVSPEAMRQAGNLVLNPSFEFRNSRDGLPLIWRCRFPLSAFSDGTAPHSGRFSVRLQSMQPDFRPLLVQTGIAVEPGRRYRLSTWYRTDGGPIEARVYTEWVVDGRYYPKVSPWRKGATSWQRLEVQFTAEPPLPAGNLVYVVVQVRGRGAAWFDDVRMTAVEAAVEAPAGE